MLLGCGSGPPCDLDKVRSRLARLRLCRLLRWLRRRHSHAAFPLHRCNPIRPRLTSWEPRRALLTKRFRRHLRTASTTRRLAMYACESLAATFDVQLAPRGAKVTGWAIHSPQARPGYLDSSPASLRCCYYRPAPMDQMSPQDSVKSGCAGTSFFASPNRNLSEMPPRRPPIPANCE